MHNEKKLSDVKGNIDEFFKSQFDPIPGTEESGGRQLFISKNQKARFGRLVERKDKSFLERYFCNQILSLKNVGYLNAQFSRISPISRRLELEGGEIVYAVWMGNIYITQINILPSSQQKWSAGVYAIRKTESKEMPWVPERASKDRAESSRISHKNLAINGYAKNIESAA